MGFHVPDYSGDASARSLRQYTDDLEQLAKDAHRRAHEMRRALEKAVVEEVGDPRHHARQFALIDPHELASAVTATSHYECIYRAGIEGVSVFCVHMTFKRNPTHLRCTMHVTSNEPVFAQAKVSTRVAALPALGAALSRLRAQALEQWNRSYEDELSRVSSRTA
jgi:hypothetical protein